MPQKARPTHRSNDSALSNSINGRGSAHLLGDPKDLEKGGTDWQAARSQLPPLWVDVVDRVGEEACQVRGKYPIPPRHPSVQDALSFPPLPGFLTRRIAGRPWCSRLTGGRGNPKHPRANEGTIQATPEAAPGLFRRKGGSWQRAGDPGLDRGHYGAVPGRGKKINRCGGAGGV